MTTPTPNPSQPGGVVPKPTTAPTPTSATPTPTPTTNPSPTPGQGQVVAPATEEEKPKKAKKPPKEKTGVARPRLPKFDETHVITVLRPNAKTRNSGERYNQYRNGMTVKEYIDKMTAEPWKRTVGQVYADLRWDTDPNRKLINIGPTVVPIPEPAPAKQAKQADTPSTPAA